MTRYRYVSGRIRTIRGRLLTGFGVVFVLSMISTIVAFGMLRSSNRRSSEAMTALQQEFDGTQRVVTAIMREIAAGMQALNTGATSDAERYETMKDNADKLRRSALELSVLSPAQRTQLEQVGKLQASVQVRLALAHAYGGTRMGDNPETNVVDRWGFAHEVPNLGILGGSVMGTSGSRNPTLTIQALAWRTAEHLAANWRSICKRPAATLTCGWLR